MFPHMFCLDDPEKIKFSGSYDSDSYKNQFIRVFIRFLEISSFCLIDRFLTTEQLSCLNTDCT